MAGEYRRDYDSTGERIINRALDHAEEVMDKVLLDLKHEMEARFERLETLIKDVSFTKKSNIWIIVISLASLAVMIFQVLFK